MYIRNAIRTSRIFAVLLCVLGFGAWSAPASAQVTISTQNCRFYFQDLPSVNQVFHRECGAVHVQMQRASGIVCTFVPPGSFACAQRITDMMRSWLGHVPGSNTLSVHAFTMDPDTCHPPVLFSAGPWCSIINTGSLDYVQAISVLSWPL